MRAVLVLVGPGFGLFPGAAAAALDHVAKEGPRPGAEADQGHLSLESVPRLGDGGVDILEFGVDVGLAVEDAPLGVEAARRAGMRAVVLTTTLPASAFAEFDNVIAIVNDFSQLDVDVLLA